MFVERAYGNRGADSERRRSARGRDGKRERWCHYLRTGNFQAANGGRKLRQQGRRKNSVTSGRANLTNVRTGIRGSKIAAQVELRPQE